MTSETLRRPIRRPEILLVTGGASRAKIQMVELRLRFILEHIEKKFDIKYVKIAPLRAYLRFAALVAADSTAVPEFVLKHLSWAYDLDFETNKTDGWTAMELGTLLNRQSGIEPAEAAARRSLDDRVRQLKACGMRPAYIFGTGPSLQLAAERSFADGITIVCNTIVRDAELWHHLSPAFLTAGDAIYHFGDNAHARAFRADALLRLVESNGGTLFVYPSMFDVIVRPEFRDVESLLIPIPWGEHTDVTVDLTDRFSLPSVENVLNALLLPLACTVSSDIRLWGFDGRGPTDTGFWANSHKHAYPELMQSLRNDHPAFFAESIPRGREIEYAQRVHGDLLEERLTDAENRGFRFRMLHQSWTPTLAKRYRAIEPESR
jgi:hypothetical protein